VFFSIMASIANDLILGQFHDIDTKINNPYYMWSLNNTNLTQIVGASARVVQERRLAENVVYPWALLTN